jgi:hypothetical protein
MPILPILATSPDHLILIILDEEYRLWSPFISFTSKYCPQHPVLRHRRSYVLPLLWGTQFFVFVLCSLFRFVRLLALRPLLAYCASLGW